MPAPDRLDPDEVECPRCTAAPGLVCRDPSGRKARTVHAARRRAAETATRDDTTGPDRAATGRTSPRAGQKPPPATRESSAKGGRAAQQARRRRKAELAAQVEARREAAETAALEEHADRIAADAARYAQDRQLLRRGALDTTAQVRARLHEAATNMHRPRGYDADGRPLTRPVQAYLVNRRTGERVIELNPDGTPHVEEQPDMVGWHAPEDVERLAKAYGSVLNALRLEEGKPTGITQDTTGTSIGDTLGEAGVDELVRWAAENLPGGDPGPT